VSKGGTTKRLPIPACTENVLKRATATDVEKIRISNHVAHSHPAREKRIDRRTGTCRLLARVPLVGHGKNPYAVGPRRRFTYERAHGRYRNNVCVRFVTQRSAPRDLSARACMCFSPEINPRRCQYKSPYITRPVTGRVWCRPKQIYTRRARGRRQCFRSLDVREVYKADERNERKSPEARKTDVEQLWRRRG